MRILVTGGTGFIGQHVAELYLRAGHQVYLTGSEAPVPGAECLGRDFQAIDWTGPSAHRHPEPPGSRAPTPRTAANHPSAKATSLIRAASTTSRRRQKAATSSRVSPRRTRRRAGRCRIGVRPDEVVLVLGQERPVP